MAEWQPIETAPRDATELLLYGPNMGQEIGHWVEPYGWYSYLTDDYNIDTPTHWMPLPEPPSDG